MWRFHKSLKAGGGSLRKSQRLDSSGRADIKLQRQHQEQAQDQKVLSPLRQGR